jgi:hypothetical protein
MKMQDVKQGVYRLTYTNSTKQLRKERPDLTDGRDLRYKAQWLEILEKAKELRDKGLDMSLEDLDQSEQMLKESLYSVGRMADLDDEKIEIDWQRIKLEAQFGDVHIEEL